MSQIWLTIGVSAQETHERGELPALTPLVHGDQAFTALPGGITYPASCSFVTFPLVPGHW